MLRDRSRDVKLLPWLDAVARDLRVGLRMLRRDLLVTTTAISSLALAIGGCSAAFALVDVLILRPLPVRDPGRLVSLAVVEPERARERTSFNYPLFDRLRGSVPLRGGFNVSAIYRNTRGAAINTTMSVSSALVRFVDPSRTTLTSSQTINLHAANEAFGDRFSQLDFALSKSFNLSGVGRLRTSIDLYNALNSNAIQAVTGTYSTGAGSRYLRPTQVLDPRVLRVTGSIEF